MAVMFSSTSALAEQINVAIIDSGASQYADYSKSFTSFFPNEDPINHGTQIAKIIKEEAPSAKIYMLQVCEIKEKQFRPSSEAVIKAIEWSVENNMDIVNMSLVTDYSKDIEDAIEDAAMKHGIVFIAASGNKTIKNRFVADDEGFIRRSQQKLKPAFPASSAHVISVGALESDGKLADYSAVGADISANGFIKGQKGTSFACARVTSKVINTILQYNPQRTPAAILYHL